VNRDEIILMAQEAGFSAKQSEIYFDRMLQRFAALVAAAERKAEREACISIAKQWDADHPNSNYGACIARRISARGQT